jgi:hypothetical protein
MIVIKWDALIAKQPLPFPRTGSIKADLDRSVQRGIEQIDSKIRLHRQHNIEITVTKASVESAVI